MIGEKRGDMVGAVAGISGNKNGAVRGRRVKRARAACGMADGALTTGASTSSAEARAWRMECGRIDGMEKEANAAGTQWG